MTDEEARNLPAAPAPGTLVKQTLTGQEIEARGDMAASATLAAQQKARVEASMILAKRFPRDINDVRVKLLDECKRHRFAQVARFAIRNRGEGFTIRFAEAAARAMTNMDCGDSQILWDDPVRRVVRVPVIDLENNVVHSRNVVIEKTVERKSSAGRTVLDTRQNSRNETVYVVVATEDEVLTKQFALESKAKRNAILAHVPGDILDECLDQIAATKQKRAKEDPDGERKALADAFNGMGIKPSDLAKLLGHRLDSTTPAELVMLREVYMALKSGEATWSQVMADAVGEEPEEGHGNGLRGLTDKLKGETKRADEVSDDDRWKLLEKRAEKAAGEAQAYRDLHNELTAKYDEGGIEAAEKWLREHPVFGEKKAAKKAAKPKRKLEE